MIIGRAFTIYGQSGYIVKTPKVVICHAPPPSVSNMPAVDLELPGGLASHLAHGDTVGICGFGGS